MALDIILGAISIGIVFLYGSVGEIITEKSGHLNLGIPGIMCMGTAGGMLGISVYMNSLANVKNASWLSLVFIPLICAFLFAAFGGLIYAFLTVSLKSNQNVVGLAITTFGAGFSQFFIDKFVDTTYIARARKIISQGFSFTSNLGPTNISYGFLAYLAILLAVAAAFILKRTKIGLRLRAVGENPATADAVGINVTAYKYFAIFIGSGIAGLGGLYYVAGYTTFDNTLTIQTFGWLAVALVIFTMWRPDLSIIGSILFGGLYVVGSKMTTVISSLATQEIILLLPYVVTIIVLIFTSIFGSKNVQPPAALGLNYFREDR